MYRYGLSMAANVPSALNTARSNQSGLVRQAWIGLVLSGSDFLLSSGGLGVACRHQLVSMGASPACCILSYRLAALAACDGCMPISYSPASLVPVSRCTLGVQPEALLIITPTVWSSEYICCHRPRRMGKPLPPSAWVSSLASCRQTTKGEHCKEIDLIE